MFAPIFYPNGPGGKVVGVIHLYLKLQATSMLQGYPMAFKKHWDRLLRTA